MRISDWSSDVCSSDLFVSIAGHYNQNRNNFFGSVSLRNDRDVPSGFPQSKDEREYDINYQCTVSTEATDRKSGVQGKSESVRVDIGGRGHIKKKKSKHQE